MESRGFIQLDMSCSQPLAFPPTSSPSLHFVVLNESLWGQGTADPLGTWLPIRAFLGEIFFLIPPQQASSPDFWEQLRGLPALGSVPP